MRNIYPFLNLPRGSFVAARNLARAYIAREFAARHDGGLSSAAYRRDCIRDAVKCIKCCNAILDA